MRPPWSASVLVLLTLGIAIRVPDILCSLDEGHRNAQTATLTAGMLENGQLRFDPIAPWRGDVDARLVQELPVYNLAVILVDTLPGVSIDMAGRITSLIFWILSFIALQALWRRTLPPKAVFWANVLFIFSPMNWYLSTAFMPESLLQLLAICFMICVLDYSRRSTWSAFVGLFLTALLGLLVKFPSFVHLGLFAALVLLDRQGWKSIFRPMLLLCASIILMCVFAWGEYVKVVNEPHFSDWAGWANVIGFIRPEASRLSLGYWLPLAGYNVAFIVAATAIPFTALGLYAILRRVRRSFLSRVWIYLLLSILTSWLIWGKGAPSQNYYNLPNLVFFSAAFGTGVVFCKGYLMRRRFPQHALSWSSTALAVSIALFGLVGHSYLSRPDRVTMEVADWVAANLPPGASVAYQPRHAASVMDYQHQPLLSHLTGRRTWILVRTTLPEEVDAAYSHSTCLIVTHPEDTPSTLETLRRRFKGPPPPIPASLLTEDNTPFRVVEQNAHFTAALSRGVLRDQKKTSDN
jgi:hypothetical protein